MKGPTVLRTRVEHGLGRVHVLPLPQFYFVVQLQGGGQRIKQAVRRVHPLRQVPQPP